MFRALAVIFAVIRIFPPAVAPGTVPFSTDQAGAVIVPVALDGGTARWKFLLDTGSSHTIITSTVADTLGLRPVAKTSVRTATGTDVQVVVQLARMAIGSAVAADLMPSVIETAEFQPAFPGIDGVLGQDFLSQFNYTLDYRQHQLMWMAEAPSHADARLDMVRVGDRFMVRVPANGTQPALWLVPDTGANMFVLFERSGRIAVPIFWPDRPADVLGVSGARTTGRIATVRELRLGAVTMRDVEAVVIPRAADDGGSGDGLLPLRCFSRVSLNSREGYLAVRK